MSPEPRAHKIWQRTTWDAPDHRVWCDCGAILEADSAREVEAAWAAYASGSVSATSVVGLVGDGVRSAPRDTETAGRGGQG